MKQNGETTLADVLASINELGNRLDRRIDDLGEDLGGRIDKLDTNVNKSLAES